MRGKPRRHYISPAGLLAGISLVLLAAAGAVYYDIYHQGDTADKNARQLLTEYNQAVSQKPASSPFQSAVSPQPAGTGTVAAIAAQASAGSAQPGASPSAPAISLPGYDVIGELVIDKIGVDLPVIYDAKWTDSKLSKALKVSVCWYEGSLPGKQGNMVITGHNYASGAHFGKLDKLAKGDTVVFDAPNGNVYSYIVYDTLTITPDNAAAVAKYEGDYALTLFTCESSGNRRLIVRCKPSNP